MPEERIASDQINYPDLLHIAESHNSTQNNSLTIAPASTPPTDLHYGWIIGICAAATLLIATTGFIITKKAQVCCFKQRYFYDSDWVSEDSSDITGGHSCWC